MKIVKVIYDKQTKFILEILEEFKPNLILESFNLQNMKESKRARAIMTALGTKKLPLIVFEDENLNEIAAIWADTNPDWREELIKKIND